MTGNTDTPPASQEACPLEQALAEAGPQRPGDDAHLIGELALIVRRLAWDARNVPADRDDLTGKLQRASAALDFLAAHGLETAKPTRLESSAADASEREDGAGVQSAHCTTTPRSLRAAVPLRRALVADVRIENLEIDLDALRAIALGAQAPCDPLALQNVLAHVDRLEAERANTLLAIAKVIGSLPEATRLRLANAFDLTAEVVRVRLVDLQLLGAVLWPHAPAPSTRHSAELPVASSEKNCTAMSP